MKFEGGCQSGRVRYRAEGPSDLSSVCYCRMCQKASGGPFMAFVRFPACKVTGTTGHDIFASSNVVERGFCKACGTPLTYRRIDGPNVNLTLNSLDDPTIVSPSNVGLATEQKAPWLSELDHLEPDDCDLVATPGFTSNQKP